MKKEPHPPEVFVHQVIEMGGRFESRLVRPGRRRIVDQLVLNPELGITPAAGDTVADASRKSHSAAKLFRRQNARDQKAARAKSPKRKTGNKPRDVTVVLCRLHSSGMNWRPALIAHFKATEQKPPSDAEATRMIGTASRHYRRHKAEFEAVKSSEKNSDNN